MKANRNRANFILILNDSRSKPFGDAIVNAAGRVNLPTMRIEVDLNGSIPIQLKGSDHASFWGKGYSAIEITDTAGYRNPYQHTNMDTVNTLDNGFSVKVISAVVPAVQNALIPNLN